MQEETKTWPNGPLYIDEFDTLLQGREMQLRFVRFAAQCRFELNLGWVIGERFDDRFDTEVGGHHAIAQQWIDASGGLCGDWKRTESGEIANERAISVIVDYANDGKRYTKAEAAVLPELAAVLGRLCEREAVYVALLAERAEQARVVALRRELYRTECFNRGVKFLPRQVLRPVFSHAGVEDGR